MQANEEDLTRAIEGAREWFAKNRKMALLGAFALGVFLGVLARD